MKRPDALHPLGLAVVLGLGLALGACVENDTARKIEELQAQVRVDQEMLRVDAETRDPTRTDLKASFVESSVMGMRSTSNPERPFVGFVRIRWHFDYTDGRPLGDAVFDYVYARTPDARWIKADVAEGVEPPPSGRGTDPFPPVSEGTARRPA